MIDNLLKCHVSFIVAYSEIGFRCIGRNDRCSAITGVAMPLWINNDGNMGLVAESDQHTQEVIGKNTLRVVRKYAGMQVIQSLLEAGENIGLGLSRYVVSLFPVCSQQLLTMSKDTGLSRSEERR